MTLRLWRSILLMGVLLAATGAQAHAAAPRITVLAQGFGQPDDLAWGPHGAIYFSDFGNNAINRLDADGRRVVVHAGIRGPEGIIPEPDGSLAVAEQATNRLLRINLANGSTWVLATIPNPTGLLGIDGIAPDPRDGSIIVPDSPSGRILRVSRRGQIRLLATGLGRPVGAMVEPTGDIVVVDEHRNGAFRIGSQGNIQQFGGYLSVPDDIVSDGHSGYFVTCLGDNTLRHIDAGGATTLVATNLHQPQGMLRRQDGTLIVAEENANVIVTIRT